MEGYVRFFDTTPHATGKAKHRCYCVWWCNANAKMDCLKCYCRRRFMGSVPTEEATPTVKVKSVFCFAIAPSMRRHGIASMLLERVCCDATVDGDGFVEAYPDRVFVDEAGDLSGRRTSTGDWTCPFPLWQIVYLRTDHQHGGAKHEYG